VPYFLVTFTVPEQLREPIRAAMKLWYGALLKESAGALQDLAADPKHLGAELGLTAVLQTWTRDQRYHPHVHVLVPGGGLTPNRLRWVRVKDAAFLWHWNPLQARFKSRLKAWLKESAPERYRQVPAKVWWLKWGVDLQPVGSGEAAVKYLANYLAQPPLRESQLTAWDDQSVTFRYRDNAGVVHAGSVSGEEFVRRCLQHVLPKGFQRVRHYGWRSAAARVKWARIVALLDYRAPTPQLSTLNSSPPSCPACGKTMCLIGTMPRAPTGIRWGGRG
jgi:hypothetical protein